MNQKPEWSNNGAALEATMSKTETVAGFLFCSLKRNYYFDSRNMFLFICFVFFYVFAVFHSFSGGQSLHCHGSLGVFSLSDARTVSHTSSRLVMLP